MMKQQDLVSNFEDKTKNKDEDNSTVVEGDVVEVYDEFESMGFHKDLLRGVFTFGFEKPSPIQQRAIVPFSKGRDMIAQAQSGTGKTATFSLGVLSQINSSLKQTQALIILPTRELAIQVQKVVQGLSRHTTIESFACIGGEKIDSDISALRSGAHVVVGTPGRVYHMIKDGILNTDHIKVLVIDEADEMLEGFLFNIKDIFSTLPRDVQVGVFSATMPPECLEMTEQFLRDPIRVLVKKEKLSLEGLTQFYIQCHEHRYKYNVLIDLYSDVSIQQAVIFCNSREIVDRLTDRMRQDSFTVSAIHGNLHPKERREVMNDFIGGSTRVLITTDLLSRGIDVQKVSVVINYDMPKDREKYLHRIGRTARYGRRGLAINFITSRDTHFLSDIERYYNTEIEPMPKNIQDYI